MLFLGQYFEARVTKIIEGGNIVGNSLLILLLILIIIFVIKTFRKKIKKLSKGEAGQTKQFLGFSRLKNNRQKTDKN